MPTTPSTASGPSSAYTWLTGDQAEGAVLLLAPDGTATIYLPPSAGPGTLTYVTDRREGALWVGGIPSAAGTAEHLQVRVRPRTELAAALRCRRAAPGARRRRPRRSAPATRS